jgi:glutamine---fructose-6-phosphate transaminase (isomerizing)
LTIRTDSLMRTEAQSAPQRVDALFAQSGERIAALAEALRALKVADIRAAVTVARGSSDHAAGHLAYLLLSRMGLLTASLPPSVITLHHAPIRGAGLAALAFSQSGQSPDLIETQSVLNERGAITAAFVNDVASPLACASRFVIDLCCGPEKSVAATKSFIAQLAAGLCLLAQWADDSALRSALQSLPDTLARAVNSDWTPAISPLVDAQRLFVVGRGAGLSVAAEMALKFKEVCGIQAEAFSAAEIKHGPMALVNVGYPVLVLAPRGPEQAGLLAVAEELRIRGATVLLASTLPSAQLPIAIEASNTSPAHWLLDAVSAVQSFYLMVEALARARGLDPDNPPHLNKVTRTT